MRVYDVCEGRLKQVTSVKSNLDTAKASKQAEVKSSNGLSEGLQRTIVSKLGSPTQKIIESEGRVSFCSRGSSGSNGSNLHISSFKDSWPVRNQSCVEYDSLEELSEHESCTIFDTNVDSVTSYSFRDGVNFVTKYDQLDVLALNSLTLSLQEFFDFMCFPYCFCSNPSSINSVTCSF